MVSLYAWSPIRARVLLATTAFAEIGAYQSAFSQRIANRVASFDLLRMAPRMFARYATVPLAVFRAATASALQFYPPALAHAVCLPPRLRLWLGGAALLVFFTGTSATVSASAGLRALFALRVARVIPTVVVTERLRLPAGMARLHRRHPNGPVGVLPLARSAVPQDRRDDQPRQHRAAHGERDVSGVGAQVRGRVRP